MPNRGYTVATLFTMGYLVIDYGQFRFLFPELNKVQKQFLWHHIIAFTGFGACLVSGFGLPGMASATLLCELSTIFLNIKETFAKENRGSALAIANNLAFFLSYTVFRMFLFPFMIYQVYFDITATW